MAKYINVPEFSALFDDVKKNWGGICTTINMMVQHIATTKYFVSPEEKEDICSEVFIHTIRYIHCYKPGISDPFRYFSSSIINQFNFEYTKQMKHKAFFIKYVQDLAPLDEVFRMHQELPKIEIKKKKKSSGS